MSARRFSLGLVLLVLALWTSAALAAGSALTWAEAQAFPVGNGKLMKYTASLTSDDTTGAVSGTKAFRGTIVLYEAFDGATTPTTAWDCTLKDDLLVDVLGGVGADVPTTGIYNAPRGTVSTGADSFAYVDGVLTLACSNMGNSKTASVRLWVLEN